MDELKDLTIERMNWEICLDNLTDAIKYLQECRERLEKALKNIDELRKYENLMQIRNARLEGMVNTPLQG